MSLFKLNQSANRTQTQQTQEDSKNPAGLGFNSCSFQTIVLFFLAVVTGQTTAVVPAFAGTIPLTPLQVEKLHKGSALIDVTSVEGGSAGQVLAVIDIPTSPSRLWTTMIDCKNASKFVSALKSCRVLERDVKGRWDVREHITKWTWMLPETRSTFRSDYDLNYSIKFRKIGGDLKKLEGEWILEPLEGGRKTRLHYMAIVDVGVTLSSIVIREVIKRDIPKTLKALRREAISRSDH